jgi:CO/xanthine dehydrogenase Mo-binding subunit
MENPSGREGSTALFARPEIRGEGPLKVTGRARYVADVRMPGMLWATFVLSPHPHARIVSIDTRAARAVPGVHAVLTAADIGQRRFGKILYDWPVLAWERVRFVGDRVAAIAAETREAAEDAAALVQVEYEELPALFDAEEALAPDAIVLHPDAAAYRHEPAKRPPVAHPNLQGYRLITKGGDLAGAFAQADVIVEDVFTAARQHQGYIEPHGCVVWIEPDGTVQVISTNKAPFALRHQMAVVTGVPAERIVVDCAFIGGDFGGKGLSLDEYACYFLAQATGRPVKSILSYRDELTVVNPRHRGKLYLRTGVTRDGRIVAHESRTYYDDGAYAAGRVLPGPLLDGWSAMEVYNVPHARIETFLVYTNTPPGGQMRAPGASHTSFAGEVHVDHIARELSIDPLELRLRNALREGDVGPSGERIRNPRAVELLETIRHETDWGAPLPPGRGRGLSLRARHSGEGKSEAALRLLPGGRIEAFHGVGDQGGGAGTVMQRVAASVLGVEPARIDVRYGTTADAPFHPGTGSSRATRLLGQATLAAATSMREKLAELAADAMDWPAELVRIEDDRFVVADGSGDAADFAAVCDRILAHNAVDAYGEYDSAEHGHEEGRDYSFSVLMVEVEVDAETGQVHPTDAVLAVDVSTIINPVAHQGQLDGGFVFGLGNALTEELELEEGRVTTAHLGDYKLPTARDIPPLRTIKVPTEIGPGPFGAKGVGENVNNAVPPAVANAVYAAIGVPMRHMPITAERVLAALEEASGRSPSTSSAP